MYRIDDHIACAVAGITGETWLCAPCACPPHSSQRCLGMRPADAHVVPAVAALLPAADANILLNICRLAAQRYLFAYQEPMPVEQLVRSVCDTKQVRSGGSRAALAELLRACLCRPAGCMAPDCGCGARRRCLAYAECGSVHNPLVLPASPRTRHALLLACRDTRSLAGNGRSACPSSMRAGECAASVARGLAHSHLVELQGPRWVATGACAWRRE